MKLLQSIVNHFIYHLFPHKAVVFYYCLKFAWRFQCLILIWRGLIHDWQKFVPLEAIYYSYTFGKVYAEDELTATMKEGFTRAWHHHLRFGPHHWQHWLMHKADPIQMPNSYVYEMICDWISMGIITRKDKLEFITWYNTNKDTILLHPETRKLVESIINDY